jgi:hypothetical protein
LVEIAARSCPECTGSTRSAGRGRGVSARCKEAHEAACTRAWLVAYVRLTQTEVPEPGLPVRFVHGMHSIDARRGAGGAGPAFERPTAARSCSAGPKLAEYRRSLRRLRVGLPRLLYFRLPEAESHGFQRQHRQGGYVAPGRRAVRPVRRTDTFAPSGAKAPTEGQSTQVPGQPAEGLLVSRGSRRGDRRGEHQRES